MDVRVEGGVPAEPFLAARDLLATERQLEGPVTVTVADDPAERTRVSHGDDGHRLTIARATATSAIARVLALHEFAHVARVEEDHPSHTQSTREAIYVGLAGESVERRVLTHCHQIANHMKDVYADDLWADLVPAERLVGLLESRLAAAVADADRPAGPGVHEGWTRHGGRPDPDVTAVNAAFALALAERNGLVDDDHPIYDLAAVAAADAPSIDVDRFKAHFADLPADPTESEYRKALVDVTRDYATANAAGRAAD